MSDKVHSVTKVEVSLTEPESRWWAFWGKTRRRVVRDFPLFDMPEDLAKLLVRQMTRDLPPDAVVRWMTPDDGVVAVCLLREV